MSHFRCPLCGRYTSYARYDPSGFDDDIFGADFEGLGRGKGFRVSARYSLLDDDYLLDLITRRCRRILAFTEGVEPPPPGVLANLQKINIEWADWGAETRNKIAQKDTMINNLSTENRKLRAEANALREQLEQSGPSIFAVEAEKLRDENNRWRAAYTDLEAKSNVKDAELRGGKAECKRLKERVAALREELEESDGEDIYLVEMEELLKRINDSSNTDYDSLSDAIDYLLEE